jgi:hypothetical protein
MSVSFDLNFGKATRKRIARSWRIKAVSMFGFDLERAVSGGKKGASEANFEEGVGLMVT